MLSFEEQAWDRGAVRVAGVDEAGRGPLAGPVCAAAVVFKTGFLQSEADDALASVADSKQLTEAQREKCYALLTRNDAIEWSTALLAPSEIDTLNILKATGVAMAKALEQLEPLPDLALVDGKMVQGLPCEAEFIVRGDSRSISIAAASIIAKVCRDRLMKELDFEYPEYGFGRHKGYGTKEHIEAIRRYGVTAHHRRSFRPVREILDPPWDFE